MRTTADHHKSSQHPNNHEVKIMGSIIHYNHVDAITGTTIHQSDVDYGDPQDTRERTYAIITNFESKHGREAWYSISQPTCLAEAYGPKVEDWKAATQYQLELMLENIVKPLELAKLRSYVELNTSEGMYGFNIDVWYEPHTHKAQEAQESQEAQPTQTTATTQRVDVVDQKNTTTSTISPATMTVTGNTQAPVATQKPVIPVIPAISRPDMQRVVNHNMYNTQRPNHSHQGRK